MTTDATTLSPRAFVESGRGVRRREAHLLGVTLVGLALVAGCASPAPTPSASSIATAPASAPVASASLTPDVVSAPSAVVDGDAGWCPPVVDFITVSAVAADEASGLMTDPVVQAAGREMAAAASAAATGAGVPATVAKGLNDLAALSLRVATGVPLTDAENAAANEVMGQTQTVFTEVGLACPSILG